MYGVISDGSGLRFEMKRRKSASCISLAVCLSSSIAEIRFINSKLRCRRARNQPASAMRIVTWNIEKGKRWQLLQSCLSHTAIRTADILCLNEVDEGMARSGNLRIGYEIGERLGMQVVFGPTFKELTKGFGDELLSPGENTTGLQGNATLSRFPVLEFENLLLPSCFDHSKRPDKRDGNRHGLIAYLDCGAGKKLTVVNTHLEVFGTES